MRHSFPVLYFKDPISILRRGGGDQMNLRIVFIDATRIDVLIKASHFFYMMHEKIKKNTNAAAQESTDL